MIIWGSNVSWLMDTVHMLLYSGPDLRFVNLLRPYMRGIGKTKGIISHS